MKKNFSVRTSKFFSRLILTSCMACMLLFSLLLVNPEKASAVIFSGSQTSSTQWTYDLIYEPYDNYSINQRFTTITLTGLFGVTSATGPVSTDFQYDFADENNLNWSAEILDGGTSVRWTHDGPGTGNYSTNIGVYGFSVFASGAIDGIASLVTDGFSTDTHRGLAERDITGTVSGPVNPGPAPVPEPSTFLLLGSGLAGLCFYARKRKNA